MKIPDDEGYPGDRLTDAERQVLLTLYDNAGETRNTDVMIRWYISAVMFPLNSALLLFALPAAFRGEITAVLIGAAELTFVYRWDQLEMRMQSLVQYWINMMITIEELLGPRIRVFGGERYERDVLGIPISTHAILLEIIRLFRALGMLIMGIFIVVATLVVFHPTPPTPHPLEAVIKQGLEQLESKDKKINELQRRIESLEQQPALLQELRKVSPAKKKAEPRRGEQR